MPLDITGSYRYPSPNPAWLASYEEPVLDPSRVIVDAHHHLWEEPGKIYLLEDLMSDMTTGGHRIEATVFAQCHYGYRDDGPAYLRPIGETERIDAIADLAQRRAGGPKVCAAIIAYADLLDDEHLERVLDAHEAAAPKRFRGVRQSTARDDLFPDGVVLRPASAGMLAEPRFRRGLERLAIRGLSFDAMIYHRQIPELTRLATDVDGATIVLDHIGCILGVGPYRGIERETFDSWRRDMRALAACPNVHVKLGGFGMIVTGAEYHLADRPPRSEQLARNWKPYVETCIEYFGAERCMFESNFPVDKAMYAYGVCWNAFKRLAVDATESQRVHLFSGTAQRVYRLEFPTTAGSMHLSGRTTRV